MVSFYCVISAFVIDDARDDDLIFAGRGSVFQKRFDGKRFGGDVVAQNIVNRERVSAGFERGNVDGVERFEKSENGLKVSGEFLFFGIGKFDTRERRNVVEIDLRIVHKSMLFDFKYEFHIERGIQVVISDGDDAVVNVAHADANADFVFVIRGFEIGFVGNDVVAGRIVE